MTSDHPMARARRVRALAGIACAMLGAGAIHAATAAADTVKYEYSTPGTYTLKIPAYTTSATVVADGASGADGGSIGSVSAGGKGGKGSLLNATVDVVPDLFVAPGDTLQVEIGARGQGGAGGSTFGTQPGGGGGGAATILDLTHKVTFAVAGGGGGGGGAGGAFFGVNGGAGGAGPGTGGNGESGYAVNAGSGGSAPLPGECTVPGRGSAGASAGTGTAAGSGGGGGDGDCPGHGGANGGSAGGGGGGGSAGGSSSWGGKNTVGVRTSDGDAYVSLTFNRSPVAPKFTSASSLTVPAVAAVDDNIAFRATATGFPTPRFALSGAPAWLSIDADSGQVTGAVPARTAGKYTFTITADNGFAVTSQPFTLDVTAAPLRPQAPGTLTGYARNPFSATLAASGGVGAYTWTKTSGSLPGGLRLSASGAITGTPTSKGTATFTARVTDSALPTAASATESVKITIAARTLAVTTKSLPGGTVGRTYSQPLAAAMGSGSLKWRVSTGTLPSGLSLDAATGRISGTPTQPGTSSFTMTVSDATMSASADLSIAIHPAVQAAVYTVNSGNSALLGFGLDADADGPTSSRAATDALPECLTALVIASCPMRYSRSSTAMSSASRSSGPATATSTSCRNPIAPAWARSAVTRPCSARASRRSSKIEARISKSARCASSATSSTLARRASPSGDSTRAA